MDAFLLNDLLGLAEEALFSARPPDDLLDRYQEMRAKVFQSVQIQPKNNLRKLRRDLQGKVLADKKDACSQINMYSELEKIFNLKKQENEAWMEGVKWEFVQRVQKSESICREYREFVRVLFAFVDGLEAAVSTLAGLKAQNREMIEFKENTDFDILKDFEDLMQDVKARQISEIASLNELKKLFKSIEPQFLHYFETIAAVIKGKEMEISRLAENSKITKDNFGEELKRNNEKIKVFEETLKKSQENNENKFQKTINKLQKDHAKKQEELIRKNNEDIQELIQDKEKITNKLQKALEEFEKNNETQTIFISQLKSEIIQIKSERNSLFAQIEKNESIIEDLKSGLDESENSKKLLEDQLITNKELIKDLKSRISSNQDENEENYKIIETKYQKIIENFKISANESQSELERVILRLENEIKAKNHEIEELYERIQDTSNEKFAFHEIVSNKEIENQEIIQRYQDLAKENQKLQENLKKTCHWAEDVREKSEKFFNIIKKKQRPGKDDPFYELLAAVQDLASDKEWLLRKLEELTRRCERTEYIPKVREADISKSDMDTQFINSSVRSFQTLRTFEKTRNEMFNNIKSKNS